MPIGSLPKTTPLYQLKLAVHTKGAFKTSGTIPNTGPNLRLFFPKGPQCKNTGKPSLQHHHVRCVLMLQQLVLEFTSNIKSNRQFSKRLLIFIPSISGSTAPRAHNTDNNDYGTFVVKSVSLDEMLFKNANVRPPSPSDTENGVKLRMLHTSKALTQGCSLMSGTLCPQSKAVQYQYQQPDSTGDGSNGAPTNIVHLRKALFICMKYAVLHQANQCV